MSRPNHTYRSERRNEWRKAIPFLGDARGWSSFNAGLWDNPSPARVSGSIAAHVARSKYRPHIGKNERARHTA